MNKRQRKKKYKKECGYNPPSKKVIGNIVNSMIDTVNCALKATMDFVEELKSMPEDEFEEKCSLLTLDQQALAKKIRNNGKAQEN